MQRKKCKEKEKLKSLRDVTPEQWRKAMRTASYWLTDQLEGHTEWGAFSEAYLGEPARRYFEKHAFDTLRDPNCQWTWKEDVQRDGPQALAEQGHQRGQPPQRHSARQHQRRLGRHRRGGEARDFE